MIFKFTENCFIMCLSFYSLIGSKEFIPTARSKLCTAYLFANSLFWEIEADVWALDSGIVVRRDGRPQARAPVLEALKDFKTPNIANAFFASFCPEPDTYVLFQNDPMEQACGDALLIQETLSQSGRVGLLGAEITEEPRKLRQEDKSSWMSKLLSVPHSSDGWQLHKDMFHIQMEIANASTSSWIQKAGCWRRHMAVLRTLCGSNLTTRKQL